MTFRGCAFLVGLLFSAMPCICQAADLQIMAEDASEPFSRADGTGYANDVVRAAFQAAGIEVKLDVVPYARCKRMVEAGRTPACFAMSWLKEFEGVIAFSDMPIFTVNADVFLRKTAPANILRPRDLRNGALVGIVNAYEYPESVSQMQRDGAVLERIINERAILKMLASGRLDAAVVMTSEFEDPLQRARDTGVADAVRFAFRTGIMKSYVGFSLKNPQGEWARQQFNDGYKRIVANGTRNSIRARWMKERLH